MELKDFSRIEGAVDMSLIKKMNIVVVGAGGAYIICDSLARFGIKSLKVLDFDGVEEPNLVRQGYETNDIGKKKVDALGEHLARINTGTIYKGITKNFLSMTDKELDEIFKDADLFLFLTDSFEAQSFGNILAQRYQKPAIWAGFYEKSRAAEIFFSIPKITPSCFRCAVSPRYEAQNSSDEEIKVSSNCNTESTPITPYFQESQNAIFLEYDI